MRRIEKVSAVLDLLERCRTSLAHRRSVLMYGDFVSWEERKRYYRWTMALSRGVRRLNMYACTLIRKELQDCEQRDEIIYYQSKKDSTLLEYGNNQKTDRGYSG